MEARGGLPPSSIVFPFPAYQTSVPINQRPPVSQSSDHHDPEPSPPTSIPSPWHRMKWTDSMVKLLIMIVYCVGDDHHEAASDHQPAKSKTSSNSAMNNSIMQKKGKWKSVSKAMMEKGFYVSPQQCEDKFNDLNKRYKRVNELIGKGTACRVVENQALLDSMDHVSAKAKEEARKLLNSKHLFFREMCAYHNGGSTCNSAQPTTSVVDEFDQANVNDEDDDFSDEEGEEGDEFDERDKVTSPEMSASLQSASPAGSASMELTGSEEEKRRWLKRKEVELEEKRVGYLYRALELDRQRFKWMRYCCNKEREMEKMKILNERRRLENERMLLLLRKKEQELVGSGAVVIDHFQQMPMH